MADLPEISQSLDEPLPQVDPNSALVPYRLARTDPGQAPVVTTGYGPRARPPVQPPEGFGGGAGMPNLDQIYQAAFSKLPVGEAVQAVNAATKFVGQRMLAKALSTARTPEEMNQAYGRFGYLAFGSGSAVPEILRSQIERERMNAPVVREAGGGLYRIPTTGAPQTLIPPRPVAPKLHFNNATGEVVQENPDGTLKTVREGTPRPQRPEPMAPEDRMELSHAHTRYDEAYRDMAKLVAKPLPKQHSTKQAQDYNDAMDDARERMRDAQAIINKFQSKSTTAAAPSNPAQPQEAGVKQVIPSGASAGADLANPTRRKQPTQGAQSTPTVTTKTQYDDLPSGAVYIGKDGKRYRKP